MLNQHQMALKNTVFSVVPPLPRHRNLSKGSLVHFNHYRTWVQLVLFAGTTKKVNFESNKGALAVSLTKDEMEEIEAAVPAHLVAGDPIDETRMKGTWRYSQSPPLTTSHTSQGP